MIEALRLSSSVRTKAGANPVQGGTAKVWIYTAQKDLDPGQILRIERTATDRAEHLHSRH